MEGGLLPLVLGSSAVTAVVGALLNALFNRYKLKADATSVLTQAAGGLVTHLQSDNGRLRAENAVIKLRSERRERAERARDAAFRYQLERHHEYDLQVVKQLRGLGIEIPDPPALEFPDYDFEDSDLIGSDGPTD